MGSLNTTLTFVLMIINLQIKWDTLSKEIEMKIFASKPLFIMCYNMDTNQTGS